MAKNTLQAEANLTRGWSGILEKDLAGNSSSSKKTFLNLQSSKTAF
jgi:hypothetical protein